MTLGTRIFGLAVFSAAVLVSSVASSDTTPSSGATLTTTLQSQVSIVQATCAGGTANGTIDLTASAASGMTGESTSPDLNYSCAGCKRYVVDIKFPAAFSKSTSAPQQGAVNAELSDKLTSQSLCESAQLTYYLYKKAAGGTTFSSIGGGTLRGSWSTANSTGNCSMKEVTGFVKAPSTPAAGETWRVAANGVVHGLSVKVKVSGGVYVVPL